MSNIGIISSGETTVSKITTSLKVETKVIMNADSSFGAAYAYAAQGDFSIEGYGTTSVAVGGHAGGPSNASGLILIESVSNTQKNDDFDTYSIKGKFYPNAA